MGYMMVNLLVFLMVIEKEYQCVMLVTQLDYMLVI